MPSLTDSLWAWRERDDVAVTFLPRTGPAQTLTGRQLIARASAVARLVSPGQPVLITAPAGLDFTVAVVGTLLAGGTAVPAYPPVAGNRARARRRMDGILADISPALALCTSDQEDALAGMQGMPRRVFVDGMEGLTPEPPTQVPDGSVLVLQYTSGSTGRPRGVRLTHSNLADNIAKMQRNITHGEREPVACSWVPPYHDMGLIGGILYPLASGFQTVLLPAVSVVANPKRWLDALERYQVTTTSTPPFALERVVARLPEAPSWDLSALRTMIVAAEAIPARVLRDVAEALAPCNLRPDAIRPAYGLAESTLLVSMNRIGDAPRTQDGVVCCGPFEGELAIVSGEGRALPEGEVGEICLRSPSVADGYQNESGGRFSVEIHGLGEGWLRTGDLGFLRDDELYVHGRIKDVLTQHGQQLHARDVEETAASAHAQISRRQVLAFAELRAGEAERAVLLVENRAPEADHLGALREALSAEHGLDGCEVVFVRPGSLIWTTSGKKSRSATRSAWLAGEITAIPVQEPSAPQTGANTVYPHLPQHADTLDERSLAYRYDLERDIPWDLASQPGIHMSDELMDIFYSEFDALHRDPSTRDTLQWALGLAMCEVVAWMETDVIHFVHRQHHAVEADRASLVAMVVEEHKHIAMFERYGEHLRAQRPELVPAFDAALRRAIAQVPLSSMRHDQPPAWHFGAWVRLLTFEEWSVWIHNRMKNQANVQPLWAAMHRAHAREEIQHVRTDAAWINSLDLDAASRSRLIRGLPLDVIQRLHVMNHTVRYLCAELWPEVQIPRPDPTQPLLALMRDPAFRFTRAVAPELVELAERGLPRATQRAVVDRVPTAAEALGWLTQWATPRVATFDPDASFAQLGLDSVDRLELSGALDAWLGGELPTSLTFEIPTPRLLAEHLASLRVREISPTRHDQSAAPTSVRQARWLDGVPATGRAHNVVGAWRAPDHATPESLLAAIRAVVAGHPALGRRFARRDGAWWQVPATDAVDLDVRAVLDLDSGLESELQRLTERPWHPERDPTLTARVFASGDRCGVVLAAPHVVADGGATALLLRDLSAALRGEMIAGADPAQLAIEERAAGSSATTHAKRAWWTGRFTGLPESPTPAPRFAGRALRRTIATRRASQWLKSRRETAFAHLLTGFALAWQRARGREAVIGTQLAHRASPRRQAMLGYLNDVVLVRPNLRDHECVRDASAAVARAWEEGLQQLLPVDDIVRHAFPERWGQRWLPAPVSFNYMPYLQEGGAPAEWERVVVPPQRRSFLFYEEMLLVRERADGSLALTLWFDEHTIGEAAATALLDAFCRAFEPQPVMA